MIETILILAAGDASRFGGFPKSNLMVDGERLLDRQVRQFRKHTQKLVLVTHRPDVNHEEVLKVEPVSRRWKCDTLLNSEPEWGTGDLLVIHGDVRFTDECVQTMVSVERDRTSFFWDGHEVFGMFTPRQCRASMLRALCEIVRLTFKNAGIDNCCGLSILKRELESMHIDIRAVGIKDETQDFDTPEEYEGWKQGWRKNKLRC